MQTTSPIHSEESTRGGRPPQPPEAASISAANPCGGNSQLFDPPSLKARRHRSVECPGTRPARAAAEYSSADPILVRLQLEGAFVSVHSVSLVSLRITCSAGIPIRLQLSKRFLESCWGRAVYRNPRALEPWGGRSMAATVDLSKPPEALCLHSRGSWLCKPGCLHPRLLSAACKGGSLRSGGRSLVRGPGWLWRVQIGNQKP